VYARARGKEEVQYLEVMVPGQRSIVKVVVGYDLSFWKQFSDPSCVVSIWSV